MLGGNGGIRDRNSRPGTAAGGTEDLIQRDNDLEIEKLHAKVGIIKDISIAIGNETKLQNSLLDSMGKEANSTLGVLDSTLRKLGIMNTSGSSNHMCYLMVFVVCVFLFLWFFIKYVRA
eukprot:JP448636.1.p1 GENE.JP448636.1~~JP448636.1.p1  ORF type:complete len:119 (+),score=13.58 JP448636.1:28-384(+)